MGGPIFFLEQAIRSRCRSGECPPTEDTRSRSRPQGASHNPSESADGKKVYYHVLRDPGEIWSIPVEGGEAVKIAGPTQRFPVGFTVTAKGIYYGPPACG